MYSRTRRSQRAICIRSDRAAARLALLTLSGRSQAQVLEDALERMPLPRQVARTAERRERIQAILTTVPMRSYPTIAELTSIEFDDEGNCL
ncbi:MAG: hypothetical protein KDA51_16645 [Planctomycetales bacterium]|nr:hypothetical protein [Planctomycetales bacterium]